MKTDHHKKFLDYVALKSAVFEGYQMDRYPQSLRSLKINNVGNPEPAVLPDTLTDLTVVGHVYEGRDRGTQLSQFTALPISLVRLSVEAILIMNMGNFVNMESLSFIYMENGVLDEEPFILPPNLTSLAIGSQLERNEVGVKAKRIWPALPQTLKALTLKIDPSDDFGVRVANLPKGLTSLSFNAPDVTLDDNDRFNEGLTTLSIKMLDDEGSDEYYAKLIPFSLTNLRIFSNCIYANDFLPMLPKSVTDITLDGPMWLSNFDEEFPKNIKRLKMPFLSQMISIGGFENLPRDFEELSFSSSCRSVIHEYEFKNLPISLTAISGVEFQSGGMADLSHLKSLTSMDGVLVRGVVVELPPNLLYFNGELPTSTVLPESLRELNLNWSSFSNDENRGGEFLGDIPKSVTKLNIEKLTVRKAPKIVCESITHLRVYRFFTMYDSIEETCKELKEMFPRIEYVFINEYGAEIESGLDGSWWEMTGPKAKEN